MIRGTTPTNIFNVDVDLTTATAIYITYNQNGKTVFEKSLADGYFGRFIHDRLLRGECGVQADLRILMQLQVASKLQAS